MKVSLNWIKDYVDVQMDVKDLAHLLTMGGLEVEGVYPVGEGLEQVVVAEIVSIRKHPNADRLSLVETQTGKGKLSIVCGASNIRAGQKVPLALAGARLPNGVEIKKSKIRGEISEGMLCSEVELGLGEDQSGIMILPPETPVGLTLGEALGIKDTILDISVTPNRPDCLCVMGIAREIAALTHQKMKYPPLAFSDGGGEIERRTSVTILDPDLCPRYVARMIEGVTIGPSPLWMKTRLEKVGIRSINNVVDVTNYVMMERGQPLHAFDFDLLEEGRIVVRRAKEGETFVTLDGVERRLDSQMLMICDGVKPVAIAGVMGGLNSEIRPNTRTVLLESAYFNPMANRRTAMTLGLETEAAYRFGRGIDPGGTISAANRATELIHALAGGKVITGVIDVYPTPIVPKTILLSVSRANQILGREIAPETVQAHLEALELKVEKESRDVFRVTPPTFRGDLEREIDLIEEIARIDGYEKIPVTLPKGPPAIFSEEKKKELVTEKRVVDVLLHHGYYEVIHYSFTSPSSLDGLMLSPEDPRRKYLRIVNPLSEDLAVMRTSLIPGLMEIVRYNMAWKNSNLRIFELKKIFLPEEGKRLPVERKMLTGLATGLDRDPEWSSSPRPVDFYDVKGCVEEMLETLQIRGAQFDRAEDVPYLHPGKALRVLVGEETLGVLGEVHPRTLEYYGIHARAYLFEMDFQQMVTLSQEKRRWTPLPKFPAIYRDVSLVIDEGVEAGKVTAAIWDLKHPLIDAVTLFDVYCGAPIPPGKKSVSYRIRYQSNDRTLTDEEVNLHHEKVISRLREAFRAELRK